MGERSVYEAAAGDGLDREAVRRRAERAQDALDVSNPVWTPGRWARHYADDVPALLDALEAAEAKEAALRAAIRLAEALRTEGGEASRG